MRAVVTGLMLACFAGLGSFAASAQQGDDCREVVRAIASVSGTSIIAKIRGRERAIGRWREKVTARYGNGFRTWLKAHREASIAMRPGQEPCAGQRHFRVGNFSRSEPT